MRTLFWSGSPCSGKSFCVWEKWGWRRWSSIGKSSKRLRWKWFGSEKHWSLLHIYVNLPVLRNEYEASGVYQMHGLLGLAFCKFLGKQAKAQEQPWLVQTSLAHCSACCQWIPKTTGWDRCDYILLNETWWARSWQKGDRCKQILLCNLI